MVSSSCFQLIVLEHGRISVGRLGNTSQGRARALDHDSAAPLHVTLLSPMLDETTEGTRRHDQVVVIRVEMGDHRVPKTDIRQPLGRPWVFVE